MFYFVFGALAKMPLANGICKLFPQTLDWVWVVLFTGCAYK